MTTQKKKTPQVQKPGVEDGRPYVSEASEMVKAMELDRDQAIVVRSQLASECEKIRAEADAEIVGRQKRIADLDMKISGADACIDRVEEMLNPKQSEIVGHGNVILQAMGEHGDKE